MSTALSEFLQATGATINVAGESRMADEPATLHEFDADNVVVPLSNYGLLSVQGPDSEKFLQGQLTCDTAAVTATHSSPGAFCTPKGRMVASFQLLRPATDQFWLRMRSDLLDPAARALGKYIVFSKAQLAPVDTVVGVGLHGPTVAELLRQLAGALPGGSDRILPLRDGLLLQRDSAGHRFEFWGPAATAGDLWRQATASCRTAGTRYWQWLNIRAGVGEVCAATTETFLPQMLNYHLNGAVNFKKGCYTGQEIVARTHYRGQVKRHLLRARLNGPAPLAGSDITAAGRVIGTVVDGVVIDAGQAELLAVVSGDDKATQPANLQAGGVDLEVLPLAYAIP